jgi:ribonuclease BN (tRNA processing enzyme)
MRLTVLGSSASYASAGRACAGHLVRGGGASVLFDCGNGVLSNLGLIMDPLALDAVIVTHAHVDHFADIYSLQAALRYAPDGPAPAMPLYLPPGLLAHMAAALDDRGAKELGEAFVVRELAVGDELRFAGLTVTVHAGDHIEPTFALRATDGDATLAYTSDVRLGERARAVARGVDILLTEATLPPAYAGRAAHMTPAEAGELAADAGVRTLVLTHFWPTVDRVAAAHEAAKSFGGRIIVADELDEITPSEEV